MPLSLVPPDAWAQRPDETDLDYERFRTWLGSNPRVPPSWDDLAPRRFEWAKRAHAWDASQASRGSATERLRRVSADLIDLVRVETQKLVRVSRESPEPTLSVRDTIAVMSYLSGVEGLLERLMSEGKQSVDLSELSSEELRTLSSLHKRLLAGR